jgi:hypothetical protein
MPGKTSVIENPDGKSLETIEFGFETSEKAGEKTAAARSSAARPLDRSWLCGRDR